jgi:hypothetical protein
VSAVIAGVSSGGNLTPLYGGLAAFAAQGSGPSWIYSFTLDAPTVVSLRGHLTGSCSRCAYGFAFGLQHGQGPAGTYVSGWAVFDSSGSQAGDIDRLLDVNHVVTVAGDAKVNGMPGYHFVATVSDSAPDAFGVTITRSDGTLL